MILHDKILYSALYRDGYPFSSLFQHTRTTQLPKELAPNSGVLILWGGEDISPSLYGEKSTHSNAHDQPSDRDTLEVNLALEAMDIGMPIIAICRGAQLMCALLGGKVIQDVTGHGREHHITTNTGLTLATSSLHHQMLYPWNIEHELLAWSVSRSEHYQGEVDEWAFPDHALTETNDIIEPEVMWFPQGKCLAIQGHPEFMREDDAFVQYCQALVNERILNAAF